MLGELWIFSLSRDTKADLKAEVMPRKKTGLSEVARTRTEGGHKGLKSRAGRIRLVHVGLTWKSKGGNFHPKTTLVASPGQGEELCPPTASSSAGPLRPLRVSSLEKGFPEFLTEPQHPFTYPVLKSELHLCST